MSSVNDTAHSAPADFEIIEADTRLRHAQCVQIRTRVFVFGQNIPAEREIDEHEDTCRHYLALAGGVPVGTVRWRPYTSGTAKVERLAVLEEARGRGIGWRLMAHILAEIGDRTEITHVRLAAQDPIIPFYQAMGFEVIGNAFEDGCLSHHNMILDLRDRLGGG
ncbi:GNAT family N-acetyltransferase [Microvirga calopogonii]|uniref:GNAT family N-acetyltransferase n=1 Tax=Microvirga calopogonii TaxID=2078013 RepID=UPI000E0D9C32|nr:GNAT family N-acetyltransferase [Microvirga calopogonii]